MRLAYLIQCHKDPQQINRLIKALDYARGEDGVDFYIHVDKKSNIQPAIITGNNIFFIADNDRINVQWGQISQVDATLSLLKAAARSGRAHDYFWFMSGQDYPIKSNAGIFDFLKKHSGKNFMRGFGPENPIYKRFLKRNEIAYPPWMMHGSLLSKVMRRLYSLVTGGERHTFGVFKKEQTPLVKLSTVRGAGEAAFYFGSAWFTLTAPCVKFILDYLEKDDSYYEFFKNVVIPDESFFLTLVFNGPFRKELASELCYVDWSEHKRNPKIFTEKDYGALVVSSCLVARKFDPSVDAGILDKLDEWTGR